MEIIQTLGVIVAFVAGLIAVFPDLFKPVKEEFSKWRDKYKYKNDKKKKLKAMYRCVQNSNDRIYGVLKGQSEINEHEEYLLLKLIVCGVLYSKSEAGFILPETYQEAYYRKLQKLNVQDRFTPLFAEELLPYLPDTFEECKKLSFKQLMDVAKDKNKGNI